MKETRIGDMWWDVVSPGAKVVKTDVPNGHVTFVLPTGRTAKVDLYRDEVVELGWEADMREPFPGSTECPHCGSELQLVEEGHERTWQLDESSVVSLYYVATDMGLSSYSDDGDGEYFARCRTCLREFNPPDDDEWEWR